MKKILRNIITVFTLVVFLITTNGISMIEHYCAEDHESFIFFFHAHPTCEDHEHHHNAENCCHDIACENNAGDHAHAHNCCSNKNLLIKLIADFLSSNPTNEVSCPVFIAESLFAWVYANPENEVEKIYNVTSPPNLQTTGQNIIKHNSQFIL